MATSSSSSSASSPSAPPHSSKMKRECVTGLILNKSERSGVHRTFNGLGILQDLDELLVGDVAIAISVGGADEVDHVVRRHGVHAEEVESTPHLRRRQQAVLVVVELVERIVQEQAQLLDAFPDSHCMRKQAAETRESKR